MPNPILILIGAFVVRRAIAFPLLDTVLTAKLSFRISEIEVGSAVSCHLVAGYASHTGIYVGNDEIVHLDGSGQVEKVDPLEFMARLDGKNTAKNIYVPCFPDETIGSPRGAERALEQVGIDRGYSLFRNNCHNFTAYCLSGSVPVARMLTRDQAVLSSVENSNGFRWKQWDRNAKTVA